MSEQAGPRTQPLSTAIKCLKMLEVVAEAESSVRISELSRSLGIPRAAVHQQLVTLVAAGWMEQTGDGSYRLTLRPARIGQSALRQAGLGERVLPMMERLVDEIREAVSLAILERGTATIIQRIEPGRPLQVDLRAEAQMPLSRSASGRVLMAYASPRQLAELRELGVDTPPEEELAQVRELGYATSHGRWLEGVLGIAAPVFDLQGRCVGALSVAGPSGRFDRDKGIHALLDAVREINRVLSGHPATEGRRQ
ncbi:DNA-binding IclR family transcriptional regulator [Thermocatellispora tengchongensis]|uniref:DNA-binding IclR family transcriptional regulator n=1 Tax=Thermocatellispora tengchongensis TaxID=1073253 RepID=A0A840PCD7_9ACTN|nr:IclR family transcriptional regulator [Thermocatellispora tengchongensis]MBB5136649.1 DNA-binding IclR family transcriptional regulator [Thermocatellispora tengchongensis]